MLCDKPLPLSSFSSAATPLGVGAVDGGRTPVNPSEFDAVGLGVSEKSEMDDIEKQTRRVLVSPRDYVVSGACLLVACVAKNMHARACKLVCFIFRSSVALLTPSD